MERLGLETSVIEPAIAVAPGLSYRNQARFLVGRGGELNFVGRAGGGGRERRWIKIPSCPVLHEKLNALIPLLRGKIPDATAVEMRVGATTGESLVVIESKTMPTMDIVAFPSSLLWISEKRGALPLKGLPLIHEVIEDVRLQISASSFFQGNTRGAETLVRIVREMSESLVPRTAVDLHAGVGLFALAALKGVPEVIGVESDQDAVLDFRWNAEGRETKVRLGDATDFVKDAIVVNETPDLVVVDPPRSGLQPALMEGLLRLLPPHVIYVSCAPDALVRDLQILVNGGYSLIRMVPVDQFAGTAHLEVVTLLRRNFVGGDETRVPDQDLP
ncbi:MAG TPA: hypothetical protein PKA37_13955, partial [Planctomycetota bacterium]|nr:hypothetical protein [Planctomycetota bacterium]